MSTLVLSLSISQRVHFRLIVKCGKHKDGILPDRVYRGPVVLAVGPSHAGNGLGLQALSGFFRFVGPTHALDYTHTTR